MRVWMISDVFFPRVNGVSTSIEIFRRQLPQFGVQVELLAPDYGQATPEDTVWRVPAKPVPRDPEDRLMSWRAACRIIDQRAQQHAPDLIHIQTPFLAHYLGVRAAKKLGCPVVTTYHTLFEEYLHHYLPFVPASWLKAVARSFSRWQCNGLDCVVVPSSAMAARLRAYGIQSLIEILPTGIPLARFQTGERARFRSSHQIPEDRPVALFVGRVAHEKNIQFLLDSLSHLKQQIPNILLVITGEGPARESLEQYAKAQGLAEHVLFLGYLNRETGLPDAYAGADVFVFASRTETQGLVLLEAMAAGLPVVAQAEMGTRDILLCERGCRVAPDDLEGFATTVAAVLQLPAQDKTTLSEQARQYAQEWSDNALAGKMANLYQSLKSLHQSKS